VRFKLNWAQKDLLDNMHDKNVILKARQLGFTTFIQIYILDCCMFMNNIQAGIIAHNREDAEDFFTKKIKFAYEHMDEEFREVNPATADSAKHLVFANGSSIRVGTSLRSGTYQLLHISEYGKISAKYPDKAREIKAGALNTLHENSLCWIESTAEGQDGEFYEIVRRARQMEDAGTEMTRMDFKFHFYSWNQDPRYSIDAETIIPTETQNYLNQFELTQAQMNWYKRKAEEQGDDMKREFPTTADEAFEASIDGAYFAKQMALIRKNSQICRVPYEASIAVNTFWDLGMNDSMTIWFHQRVGMENRFIDYYENSGEGFAHYKNALNDRGYTYDKHYGPHDLAVRELGTGTSRLEAAKALGITFEVVKRVDDKLDAIEAARGKLSSCWFDETKCTQGIRHLDNYRKEWNDSKGVFKDGPRHDAASHGADGFMTFATGYDPVSQDWGKLSYSNKGIV